MSLRSGCKILTISTKEKSFVKFNDRNSTVGTVTRLRAGRFGVLIPVGTRDFSLLQDVWTDSGTQLATYPMGTGVISRNKAAVGKVNHSRSAQIKNSWSNTSNPPIWRHDVEWDNFNCTVLLYRLSWKLYTKQLIMKIVITYAEFLPFSFRKLNSEYSSNAGKISINIDWLQI